MQIDALVSDGELVTKLEMGEEWAFSEIYRRYWKKLFRQAFSKTGSDDSAKEIVQDIFLDLWQRRETAHIQELERYLFKAVRYQVLDCYNKRILKKRHIEMVQAMAYEETTESVEDQMAFWELKEKIMVAIGTFPEKTRHIFTLNRLEGKSVVEIAGLLHLPERTVEYHITVGLRHLREHLREYIISYSALIAFLLISKG
jgi:RNA polymerase sigma-70 factor (family 1)